MKTAAILLLVALFQSPIDPTFPGFTPYDPEHAPQERPEPGPPYVPAATPDAQYPLHLHVLATNRKFYGPYYLGSAVANLDGTPRQGLEIRYKCTHGFAANSGADDFYRARWKKPGERMEILIQKPGATKPDRCEIFTKLKDAPYHS